MIYLLGQVDALKGTPYYAMFAAIIAAFIGAGCGWTWMRSVTKAEAKEAVEAATLVFREQVNGQKEQIRIMGDQIERLNRQVSILQNGHQKAARRLVSALEELSETPAKVEDAKRNVRLAFEALSGIQQDDI